jgi:hypothetical protein
LPNGAGTNVLNVITNFTSSNNYFGVNLGQLKYVATPFYDRLITEGCASQYPWTGATQTNDYAMANIGQLKNVFSFSIDTNTIEHFVYTERETGNTRIALFSRVSIIGSTLRVTLWGGPDYYYEAGGRPILPVMNGSYQTLRDTDSAELIAWWGTNGTDNLLPQPGWNTTNREFNSNVAYWVCNGANEVYWETTNLPDSSVSTQLDVVVVYTDIIYEPGIWPPTDNGDTATLKDKPNIIGYWHACYDTNCQVWNWDSIWNLAPTNVSTTNYQGEVLDVPITDNYTNDFVMLTNQVTHVQNVISNMTSGAYQLGYRSNILNNIPDYQDDSGFDIIRTNHVPLFPWSN